MASSTAKKKTNTKSAPKKSAAKSAPVKEKKPGSGSVVWGVVCLVIAALALIGFFTDEGIVVVYFCAFLKGVLGYGFWLFPFALIWCAVLLFMKKPLRTIPVVLLPLLFGALLHLLLASGTMTDGGFSKAVSALYTNGKDLLSGGVLGGGLAALLRAAISVYGAVAVVIALFIVCLLIALKITPAMIRDWYGDRADDHAERKAERAEKKQRAAEARAQARLEEPWDEEPLDPEPPRRSRRAADMQVATKKLVDIPFSPENPNLQPEIPEKPSRRRASKKAQPQEVEPLSVEEAADLAGVDI